MPDEDVVTQEVENATGKLTTLSKRQAKKLERRKGQLESRPERRKLERERKKLKRREQARLREENGFPACGPSRKPHLMADSENKFRVVIDMDFEEQMTDSEIAKSVQQVGRIYALNRHSSNPCQLYVSSLKGKVRDKFASINTSYTKWDINISDKDYLELFSLATANGYVSNKVADTPNNKTNILYLTGDTEETLPDVSEILKDDRTIFVIGGLVDHNRHKNLCYERAKGRSVKTAKLPIKEYVKLCQRDILSTVTVFDIMLRVLGSHKSWRDAFLESIPKRKIIPRHSVNSGSVQELPEADSETDMAHKEDDEKEQLDMANGDVNDSEKSDSE